MKKQAYISIVLTLFFCVNCFAQSDTVLYVKDAIKSNRVKTYNNIINHSITKNLSLPLTDSTEENWQDAFYDMELINYKAPWVNGKIKTAFDSVEKRSPGFQRAYLELIYTNYPKDFVPQVQAFIKQTMSPKLFAMGAEYILLNKKDDNTRNPLLGEGFHLGASTTDPFLVSLEDNLIPYGESPAVADLLSTEFLKNEIVLFSFQRKNRNYPGLAMVRGKDGVFIKDENGNYFSVPQLARSITNMPGYLTNGNTPQGIFKMTGFDISKGSAIGPTTNIQMVLPFEKSTEVPDSITQLLGDDYKYLLPASWKQYYPFYEAYYAGKAGRTEIIAHGTTIDPGYYKGQPYYPLTPTQGCLCTKEIWSQADGRRLESNQQKLVDAVKKAGGADGYCIVIEIDDQQKPVSINEILPYLK